MYHVSSVGPGGKTPLRNEAAKLSRYCSYAITAEYSRQTC